MLRLESRAYEDTKGFMRFENTDMAEWQRTLDDRPRDWARKAPGGVAPGMGREGQAISAFSMGELEQMARDITYRSQ